MDPAIVAMILKSVLAALLIVGGIAALFIGKSLFLKGAGLQSDGTKIETKKIKASLKTVGSVVMATSIAWGGLGYLASPSFSYGPEGTKVASFTFPELDIKAASFAYQVSEEKAKKAQFDPKALSEIFALAYERAQDQGAVVTVNNQPATSKFSRIGTLKTMKDHILVVGIVNTAGKDVALTYKPTIRGENVSFVPQEIGLLEASSPVHNEPKAPNKTLKPTP
jgi:hypothetical protein